jgi:hypothetical protein
VPPPIILAPDSDPEDAFDMEWTMNIKFQNNQKNKIQY